MVHGGGHHHHHHGGGGASSTTPSWGGGGQYHMHRSGWGGGGWNGSGRWNGGGWGGWGGGWGGWGGYPQQTTNVMIFDTGGRRARRSYQQSLQPPPYTTTSDSDECDKFCRRCFLMCCACCGVASVAQSTKKGGLFAWMSLVSIVVFVVLMVVSRVDETWTLNAGETRRMPSTSLFTQKLEIESQVADSIKVYNTGSSRCPPLTGPTVPFDSSLDIELAPDDYQFDYFYLNKDSYLNLTLQQEKGATNVYLFTGNLALQRILQPSYDEEPFSPHDAVIKRYVGASQQVNLEYTVPKTNVYILVYDSASSSAGKTKFTIHLDMTTYNLKNLEEYSGCSAASCVLENINGDCVLVQAQSETTIHLTGTRRWLVIVLLTLAPLLFGVLYLRRQEEAENATPPPATNPEANVPEATAVSTAPLEDYVVDYESIPIVAAEEVVPMPVDPNDNK